MVGVKGWKNAANITGKKEKDLTIKDKLQAASAGALSTLTLGLVKPQTIYKVGQALDRGVKKALKYTPIRCCFFRNK